MGHSIDRPGSNGWLDTAKKSMHPFSDTHRQMLWACTGDKKTGWSGEEAPLFFDLECMDSTLVMGIAQGCMVFVNFVAHEALIAPSLADRATQ